MVTVEALGFTMPELIQALDDGEVRVQQHPEFPELKIFNYTEDTAYRGKWYPVTLACRGLIINMVTNEVVARPWEKFFNLGQRDNRIAWDAPVEVTDKLDGSLGILYQTPDNLFQIATRGSFASEQANHATEVFATRYLDKLMLSEAMATTFLFEIVYPENRIVVNYGDMDDLVMLGAVDKQYGYYYGPDLAAAMLDWPGPVAESFFYKNFTEAISAPDRVGKEGYVIRSGTNIVKLKQADYVELHRIVTNLSPKTIWEQLGRGRMISEICKPLPDELHKYVEEIGGRLLDEASKITYKALGEYQEAILDSGCGYTSDTNRKLFAAQAKTKTYPALMFMQFDNKPIHETVWKMVKPRGDVKALVEDEG